jgi:hypothetical protein
MLGMDPRDKYYSYIKKMDPRDEYYSYIKKNGSDGSKG